MRKTELMLRMAGVLVLLVPGSARAGGWHWPHCGWKSTQTSFTGASVPSFGTSAFVTSAVPTMSFVPAYTTSFVPTTAAFTPVTFAPSFNVPSGSTAFLPSFAASNACGGTGAAAAGGFSTSSVWSAYGAAYASSAAEAQLAAANYPMISAAAQQRGRDPGRIILFLKNLIRAGGSGDGLINILGQLLGLDPVAGGLGPEIGRLIGEVLGGGPNGGGTGAGGERCITIRVCCDGSGPVVGGGTPNPPVGGGLFGPEAFRASGSPQATPAAQAHPAGQATAPTFGDDPPVPPPAAAPEQGASRQEERHRELMKSIDTLNSSLERIAAGIEKNQPVAR
jgi:hypothetical protein